MGTNFVQPGETMTYTAGATHASGDPVLVGVILGIATKAAVSGDVIELAVEGVFTINKDTALVISQGDRLFWDATNSWLDKTAAAQSAVAIAWEDAASAATTIKAKLIASTPAGT